MKVSKEYIIENENGLHARPSSSFVKKANEFQSHIVVTNEKGEFSDGKSVLGLMCLSAEKGSILRITADGSDAIQAIYALGELFKNKFGEEV